MSTPRSDDARGGRRFAGLLLAAGASSRMGAAKQLLEWEGEPLLVYQRRQLEEAVLDPVVVVLGARARELRDLAAQGAAPVTRVVENPQWQDGKTTSIRRGLAEVSGDAGGVLILSVDQPRPARILCELLAAHLEGGRPITVPTFRGRGGHPPVFAGALLAELGSIREEGQGLRDVLRRHERDVLKVEIDDPLVIADLNRPEDYRGVRGGSR